MLCFLQHRFIVRDFNFDPKAIAQERLEKSKLEMQLKKQFVSVSITRHISLPVVSTQWNL